MVIISKPSRTVTKSNTVVAGAHIAGPRSGFLSTSLGARFFNAHAPIKDNVYGFSKIQLSQGRSSVLFKNIRFYYILKKIRRKLPQWKRKQFYFFFLNFIFVSSWLLLTFFVCVILTLLCIGVISLWCVKKRLLKLGLQATCMVRMYGFSFFLGTKLFLF